MLKEFKRLKDSQLYKDWKKENKDSYFCSAFIILSETPGLWHFDFYETKKDKITSFVVGKGIESEKDLEIFRKEKAKVNEFNLKDLKFTFENALKAMEDYIKKNYKDEKVTKRIIIVQHLKEPVWNITYLTNNFNIINVKLDTRNGKLISAKKENFMKFKAG